MLEKRNIFFKFQIMEQKNIKIVLFMTMLLSTEFAKARPDLQDAIENLVEFDQDIGTGTCTEQRYNELNQATKQCTTQVQSSLGGSTISNVCSIFGKIFQCIKWHGECYNTQELKRFMGLTLQLTVEGIKLVSEDLAAKFEECPKYKDFASKGSVAGNNMGIMIALIIVVAYFGF